MTTERKTLSIKKASCSYGTMWPAPSDIDDIVNELKQSVSDTLKNHKKTTTVTYDQYYRLNLDTEKSLKDAIEEFFKKFQVAMKYPAKRKEKFEEMTQKIYNSLLEEKEIGSMAEIFEKVVDSFLNPKQVLPKVPCPMPKRNNLG